jgi:hypothetical protein
MKNAMKTAFGCIAGAALALTSTPALAEDAANTNAPVSAPLKVQYVDARNKTIDGTRGQAAIASHNKVAIVVWGGNRALQEEAYKAALDLIDRGIPVAFVHGPDKNGYDVDANFRIYAMSEPRFNEAEFGTNKVSLVHSNIRDIAIVAHNRFVAPQKIASLGLD